MKTAEDVYEFMRDNKIPRHIPREFDIEKDYYTKGVIRGEDLKDGHYYIGKARNFTYGKWDAGNKLMWHQRYKFGYRKDNINYLDNDNGFDLFIAIKEVDENDVPEELRVDTFKY